MLKWLMGLSVVAMLSSCTVTVDGGSDTYDSCITTTDCISGFDQCIGITPPGGYESNMCTHTCTTSLDCEYGGICADYASSGYFLCYQACSTSLDCEFGFECLALGSYGNGCFPDGSGN